MVLNSWQIIYVTFSIAYHWTNPLIVFNLFNDTLLYVTFLIIPSCSSLSHSQPTAGLVANSTGLGFTNFV